MRELLDDLGDGFVVIAHRGNSSVAPENTLVAFEAAETAGIRFMETDLRLTSDGTAVLLHDDSLDRTTDRSGKVADCDAETLSRADAGSWFSPDFAGVRLPTLADLLGWAGPRPSVQWLLEFKGTWTPAQIVPVVNALRDAGVSARCLVQTFDRETLLALASVAPEVPRAFLTDEAGDINALLQFLEDAGTVACNPSARIIRNLPDLLPLLRAAGQLVFPWTVDDPAACAALKAQGANGVISNRPAVVSEGLRQDTGNHPSAEVS